MRNLHDRITIINAIMAYCISTPGATKPLMSLSLMDHVRLAHVRWMNSSPPEHGIPL